MSMKWDGAAEFRAMTNEIAEEVRVATARSMMESAKQQRDDALQGFATYGIRLITGRSRALYSIAPGEGMFQPYATKVEVSVGYNEWPETDIHSPDDIIAFYPWFLNYGTRYMKARPFHTAAMEKNEEPFYDNAFDAMDKAFRKASAKYREPI